MLVTPAFPEIGRTVYQGNLFVGSVPLNESPLKDHPLNPMHDSNLVRVLSRQSKTKIGLVDLAVLARGRRCGARASCRSGAARALALRSSMRCLIAISRPSAAWRWIIASRSAPPALGLGWRGRWSPLARSDRTRRAAIPDAAVGGPAACLAGSCSQATLGQIANAEKTHACAASRSRTRRGG